VPYEIEPVSVPTVWVYKYRGDVQCGTQGIPLEVMEKTLTEKFIEVFSSCRSGDGLGRPAVCGFAGGSINAYEIDADRLPEAINLGFAEVSKLPGYKGRSVEKILGEDCSQRQS
jgi:hypothetical protein